MATYDLNLRDYWRIIRKRRFIIIFTVFSMGFFSLVWSVIGQPVPLYKTSVGIKIEQTSALTGLYSQSFPSSSSNYLETQASVIKSYVILEAVAKKLNLIPANLSSEQIRSNSEYLKIILDLKSKVETEQEGNTDIINVNITSEDPKHAQRLANTIAQVYKEEHLLDINKRTLEAKKFIENQLNISKEKVLKSEDEVRNYREQNKLISIDAESSASLAQSSRLQTAYDQDLSTLQKIVEMEKILAAAEDKPLSSKTSFYFDEAPQIYKNLNDKLVQITLERDILLLTYTENFPQIEEIKKQIREIIISMKAQLSPRRKQLEANIKNFKLQIAETDENIKRLPQKGLELVRLEREAGVNREVYTLLEKKYQEALIQDAEKIEEVKIVKPALEPTRPINPPKTSLNTVVGSVIGLIIGIVFAFIMETFDTSIGAIEEVEEFLGVHVLGIIPHVTADEIKSTLEAKYQSPVDDDAVRKAMRLIAHFLPNSSSTESYRALRTNLNFLNLDKKIKTIIFTSASPEEGKTTISVNLAIAMAQGGTKVLLVEGDIRRPVFSRLFGINPHPGLTDVVLGNYDWRNVVRTITDLITGKMSMDEVMLTPGMDNLYIITAGTSVPNPAEVISSSTVNNFIKQAVTEYDMILIDAPPILAATDAAILSSFADGAILVYQVGRTARGALKRAKAQLDNIGAKTLGVVLNGLKAEISPDFAYHDKYYYYYSDSKIKKPTPADKIRSIPELITNYIKTIKKRLIPDKQEETGKDISHEEIKATEEVKGTEEVHQKKAIDTRSKIMLLVLSTLFLIFGVLFQTGLIQNYVPNIFSPQSKPAVTVKYTEPSKEKVQPPPNAESKILPQEPSPVQVSESKPTQNWGAIMAVKDKTNIRADRSIDAKIVKKLLKGQKVKADFLKDDWYAVFNLNETLRDEKISLGYVYASLLYPLESVRE